MKKQLLLLLAALLITSTPGKGETNIRYCYNCEIKKTVVKRSNTVVAPVAVVAAPVVAAPVVVSPYPYAAAVPVQAPVAYVAGPRGCVWYPDPYTFLGEIFGYDYIQVCQ
jgi:hypothetical protein